MGARPRLRRWRPGRAVPLPADLGAELERVFGCPVAGVRIIEHSWFARLHGRALATTRPERIYLRGSAAQFFADPVLLLHEYAHVLLQWRRGTLTVPRYLLECLRRGYWHNRFEVEARALAAQHAPRVHAFLQAAQPSSASRR
ncbi:MAG: hypothetical protein JOZ34_05635 [Gammaproteobacteria bacterium]|nr:hypothetical protein [Gammaproteobacteria bacterium]